MSVLIGLNSYNDLPFLRENLPVLEQLREELKAKVVVLDTAWNDEVKDFVEGEFPAFEYLRHADGNIGYGRSYNEIWRQHPDATYFLVVTSDVFLDVASVKLFVKRMKEDGSIAMCAGKLHHWDLKGHRKTRVIDSLGIVAEPRHHFYDKGHGEEDRGQYDEELGAIFGISGAVFLIRGIVIKKMRRWTIGKRSASLAAEELFDDRMWMYKEDIDLAYRLRWLDEKIVIFPEVWAWHARTVANKEGHSARALAKADSGKRDYGRAHSYKNHFLLLKNNFTWRYGPVVLFQVLFYEIMKGLYMLFRHPAVFLGGLKILLFVRSQRSPRVASTRKMLSHFQ